jgi:16S rRNA (adenine1518-N6/adenine1519-N6)-dimethyltransferase
LFADSANVEIIHGDIMKLDVAALLCEKMPGMRYHVCANLPYNITTPALTMLINSNVFETITVMAQKEVVQRICAQPGSSEYGAFTVFVNYHSEPETLFDVPPECFFPRPGVVSSVVTMKIRTERLLNTEDETLFFRVVRAAFEQRRKTLVNALFASFGNTLQKPDIEGIVRKCGFDTRIRGEMLGIKEFICLTSNIKQLLF